MVLVVLDSVLTTDLQSACRSRQTSIDGRGAGARTHSARHCLITAIHRATAQSEYSTGYDLAAASDFWVWRADKISSVPYDAAPHPPKPGGLATTTTTTSRTPAPASAAFLRGLSDRM